MDFLDFARSFGIIINDYPPIGVWKRYPTDDHPRSRNGAVKFLGTVGFVQNHAMDTVVSVWKPDAEDRANLPSMTNMRRQQLEQEQETRRRQSEAARKAVAMLNQSGYSSHAYLRAKGFEKEQGNVYHKDGKPVLLIPMRVGGSIVGVQQIDEDGGKRFLYGQRSAGASFVFSNNGLNILCEGYATALSVRAAMTQIKRRYSIHVCFSAGNMKKIGQELKSGVVVADNDHSGTGQQAAADIGWPYWMSDSVGEDANDYMLRVGLFGFSQSLTQLMLNIREHG
jgi:putative DNA primase/helicase